MRRLSLIGMIWLGMEMKTKTSVDQARWYSRYNRSLLAYTLLLIVNMVLFSYTDPLTSPSVLVIGGFLLVSIDLAIIVHFIMRFLCLLVPSLERFRKKLIVALVSFGVVAIALASLGQLTWRDVLVVVIIWVIGYLYSLRVSLSPAK
jgi:hypothetical protein